MSHEFYCGAAKRCITPSPELLPNLRALQDRHFGGVLDDICLRVLALRGNTAAPKEPDAFQPAEESDALHPAEESAALHPAEEPAALHLAEESAALHPAEESAALHPAGKSIAHSGNTLAESCNKTAENTAHDSEKETTSLLIVFELDKVPHPQRFLTLLTQETGVKEENILLTAVHTHTAPITGDRPFEGPNNIAAKPAEVQKATHEYETFLEENLLSAAREALARMTPARMGMGIGKSDISVSRKQWYEYRGADNAPHRKCALGASPETPIDRTVYVLKFEALDGQPLAFFINYPVHCCVLHTCQCFDGKLGISGDIAGRVSRFTEEAYPGAVALWCSGAAGDINPIMQNEIYYPDPVTGDAVTEIMPGDNRRLLTVMANRHYDDVRRISAGITCTTDTLALGGCVEWSRTPGIDGDYEVRLQMMRLGDTILFGASGELYNGYARRLKALLPEKHVIVVNHVASLCANSGYILDDEALLMPEVDLPGVSHTNMKPGYFTASLLEHAQHMYGVIR